MDEEFLFPQNVRTTYRLWVLGPRHLKRLGLAPILAMITGWLLHELPLALSASGTSLVVAGFCGLCVVPVTADEQTAWDVWREIRLHRRVQTQFHHPWGGIDRTDADSAPPWD